MAVTDIVIMFESVRKIIKEKEFKMSLILFAISIILSSAIEFLMMQEKGYVNPYRWFMHLVIILVVSFGIAFHKLIWEHAHIYYFVVSLLIGMVAIVAVPFTHISWDEPIHFYRTSFLSWGATGEISVADNYICAQQGPFNRGAREDSILVVNLQTREGMVEHTENIELSYVAYIPAALMMALARWIGCSVYEVYMLGKFTNLFCYSLFMALAIRNFKGRGKLLATALGLIPVCMFVSVCYSYDWWVISLIILGYSIFIREIQEKGFISTNKLIQSVIVVVVGLLVKAVYFPIMFPMMLLKKEQYSESKKARIIVLLGMLIALSTFVLPILFAGAGTGDSRGGEGVNASEQIMFILENIPRYLDIMFGYFKTYLSLDNAHNYLVFLAYLGHINYGTVVLLIICVATLLDNSGKLVFRRDNCVLRAGNCLGVFGALSLVATALYVSYTPVGLDTINGCQYRYIIPVLFPLLFFSGEYGFEISEDVKRKFFVFEIITLMLIFMNGYYNLIIMHY